MHRLIFNGCSFVHGFDCAWDYSLHPRISEEVRTLGSTYWHDLQKVNLSGQVAKMLGIPSVRNLARNGNSNDIIVFETMQHLESLDQHVQPIVFIGWTEPARMLVFDEQANNSAMSINPFLVNDWIRKASAFYDESRSRYLVDFYSRFAEASKHLVRFFNHDLLASNLLRSVLCLQGYLESRKIPYVFWNSLEGMPCPRSTIISNTLPLVNLDSWMNLDSNASRPAIETGWKQRIGTHQRTQTAHPGQAAIGEFAQVIADFVRNRPWFSA